VEPSAANAQPADGASLAGLGTGPGSLAAGAMCRALGHARVLVRRTPWGLLTAGLLVGVWWLVAPRSPDLAAQAYRVGLFERAGFVLWDNSWYAGHHVPGYSLTWPWLASWLGLRASGVLAVLASVLIFERLARALYGPAVKVAVVWFAVAAAGDAWIGRLTFALGVTFALAAALAMVKALALAEPVGEVTAAPVGRGRDDARERDHGGHREARRRALAALAALLAMLSAASSPVAGLLLALAACSWSFAGALEAARRSARREPLALASGTTCRLRQVAALVTPPLAVAVLLQLLFPEGGFEPYSADSLAAALAVTVAFMLALPPEERGLRIGAGIYALVNLLCLIPTPMGSNVQRYGVLLSGPLLLCALYRARDRRGPAAAPRGQRVLGLRTSRLPRWALIPTLAGMAIWVVWGPVVQTLAVSGDPSTRASFYVPVERFLASHSDQPLRIEVPFTRAHWEAAFLAPHVALARGWERQLDKRYDRALEAGTLSAASYREWLAREGVSYVALPDVPFDYSSTAEAALIRGGLPYLHEVFRDAHWRIYRVVGASPLVVSLQREGARPAASLQRLTPAQQPARAHSSAPAQQPASAHLTALEAERFTVWLPSAGRFLVKIHYTPYWSVVSGQGGVVEARDGFTELRASRAGAISVAAGFSMSRAWRAVAIALGAK
jgi:hypothetical protein